MSDEEKLVSHYRLKNILRRDGFGAVYFAEDTRDQKACVLRIIELDHPTLTRITGRVRARSQRDHPLIEQIRQRMKRIAELKNSHILPVIEFGEEHIQGNNDIIFYMVSPYEKESLLSYWSERAGSSERISLEIVVELISQAAEALYYVHRRGLIHQYVRLSSFMLRSTARSRRLHLYLTDFWFADITDALLEEGQISRDLSVYLASEQLAGKAVFASDQYALAVLAYELLLGYRLSQVDISLGLYERFLRQRGAEVSAAELDLAHRLDLVLVRALAEDASARYHNIEEFASVFRAVASGEAIELEDDTAKLPAVGHRGGQGSAAVVAAAAGAAGILATGEIVEEVTEAQVEESGRQRHPSLHKTVLTSEGMEVVEETVVGETTAGGAMIAEEETQTTLEEERSQSAAGTAGAAGFVAGLAAGASLQREADLSAEQTQIAESSAAAFAAGEVLQREQDRSEEKTLLAEGAAAAFAAGLAAGEERQRERDLAEEREELRESSAAAFVAGAAAGEVAGLAEGEKRQHERDLAEERTERRESSAAAFAAGAAAGLAAGEAIAFAQETDISEEQTQIISSSAGGTGEAAIYEQETDIAEEQTQIIPASGMLLAGAAGLAVGELLSGGAEGAAVAGGGVLSGGVEEVQSGSAGGMSVIEEAEIIGGAAAAGLAAGGIAGEIAGGAAGGGAQAAGGVAGGAAGGGAQAAGGGSEGGYAGGGTQAAGGATGGGYAGETTQNAAGVAESGLAGGGYAGEATQVAGGAVAAGAAGLAASGFAAGGYAGGGTAGGYAAGVAGGGATGSGVVQSTQRRRRRRGRTLLAAIIIALLLLLLFGGVFVFALNQSSATVTLTLESHTVQNTYLVTATTSTTTTGGQIQASILTQTNSLSKSGQASGYYSGAHSSGFIKFYNSSTGCGCPIVIPAGTVFTGGSGVAVVTDEAASVASLCYVTVHAHAIIYGPGGNIPAGDVQAAYSSKITATNPYAFSGGQYGQSNALVQQSDINRLARSLQAQVVQSAQTNLQAQLKSNQHLFAQPDCTTKVKSDHAAGDFASSVNVTVTATCKAEAYDYSAAIQVVRQQVQTEASSYSSDQYVLVNGLQTTVTSATVTDAKAGTLLLAIKAIGKWVRKLGSNLQQSLPRVIAGKSVSDARLILSQIGVASVNINVSGRDPNTLPSDSSKITIVVKS